MEVQRLEMPLLVQSSFLFGILSATFLKTDKYIFTSFKKFNYTWKMYAVDNEIKRSGNF